MQERSYSVMDQTQEKEDYLPNTRDMGVERWEYKIGRSPFYFQWKEKGIRWQHPSKWRSRNCTLQNSAISMETSGTT